MKLLDESRFKEITGKFKTLQPVLVVGDVGIDKYTYGEVHRISPEAPVPVLEVSKEWFKLGLAANVSDNLKSLEVNSTLCGVIGNDRNGDLFESILEESGLKTWGIVRSDKRATTFKERITTNTQQICRVDYESVEETSDSFTSKVIDRVNDFFDEHNALILEDYAKGLLTEKLCQELIKKFNDAGKLVAVDPGRTTPPKIYKGAKLLKPNRLEAKLMVEHLGYREKSLDKISEILMNELDLHSIVITLGADGIALRDREKYKDLQIIPTLANEVFDVSGAGDTAISTIVSALMAGADLMEAAWLGNCASGVVVGKKGTASVGQDELHAYFKMLEKKLGK